MRAIEGGLGDLGGGCVEGEDEGVEDEFGVGRGETEEGGGGGRGVGEGFETVEGRLAGGDEGGVFAPGGVLDDLVEYRGDDAAGAGSAAEGDGESHCLRRRRIGLGT